jgi:hypothetical protein
VKKKNLRDRFDSKGFGVVRYAKAFGLNQSILSRVLSGDELLMLTLAHGLG